MLRKLSLVAVAAVSLGAAALAPTPAAAWGGWQGGWHGYHHAWGPRFFNGVPVSYGYGGCYVRCAPTVPDPLGYPLAAGQPLLLNDLGTPAPRKTPASRRGFGYGRLPAS
jgi:hypothetical protein